MPINTSSKQWIPNLVSRQVISIDPASYETLVIEATSRRSAAAIQSDLLMIWGDQNFRVNFGTSAVVASGTSMLLPGNVVFTLKWNPGDYLATYTGGTDGVLHLIGVY